MSGIRQHYIPQALMRGFSQNRKQVYQYRKDKPSPVKCSIAKVGVEKFFYGEENSQLDGKITSYEQLSISVLNQLQQGIIPERINDISKFVLINSIRTNNFRSSANEMAFDFQKAAAKALQDIDLRRYLVDMTRGKFGSSIDNKMKEMNIDAHPNSEIIKQVFLLKANNFLTQMDNGNIFSFFTQYISQKLKTTFPEIGHNVQSRIIPLAIDDEAGIIKKLIELKWCILQFDDEILLGDSSVIFGSSLSKYGIFYNLLRSVNFVLMPITSKLVLMGSNQNDFELTGDDINSMFSSVSYSFYVSETERNTKYVPLIGSKTGILIDENLEDECRKALGKILAEYQNKS